MVRVVSYGPVVGGAEQLFPRDLVAPVSPGAPPDKVNVKSAALNGNRFR